MEIISEILEASSELVDLFSQESKLQKDAIRKFVETRLKDKCKIKEDFKSGLDWLNVTKELSFTKELKGKLVVLDFFTYCCINCMHILPQLKALEHEFSIEDGLVVIGVHSPKFPNEHSTANVEAAVKRYEISHPVVNDPEEHLWTSLGICCWPTLVVVGPNRELMLYLLGESHEQLLHLFVRESLSILKAQGAISSHSLPDIGAHNLLRKPEELCFPGKVCVTQTSNGSVIAVADTGNHRVLVVDSSGQVQYVIGGEESGFEDGDFKTARFHGPQGMVFIDSSTLFVADTENHAIRKIDLTLGLVETVAGDGTQGEDKLGGDVGRQQKLSSPWDLALLGSSVMLIAMAGTHQIWAYFFQDTVFWKNKQYKAGSCAAVAGSGREENRNNAYPQSAGFAQPSGLTVHESRHAVYLADSESSSVRSISITDGKVTGLVGGMQDPQNLFAFGDKDGSGLEVRLQHPMGVSWSEHKQLLYVCDSYNHKVKVVNPTTRRCSTLSDTSFNFNEPGGLCADSNLLYVADTNNHCIKVINLDNISVHILQLRFKKPSFKENKSIEPVKEEYMTINSEGGVFELGVTVQCSAGIKPLEETPAVWSIDLPEGWRVTKTEETGVVSSRWTVAVPAGDPTFSYQLRPQCRLFYCHNSLCSVKVLPFFVTVTFSDSASSQVSCQLQYSFSV